MAFVFQLKTEDPIQTPEDLRQWLTPPGSKGIPPGEKKPPRTLKDIATAPPVRTRSDLESFARSLNLKTFALETIRRYYGADAARIGRVAEFVGWLEKNADRLDAQFKRDVRDEQIKDWGFDKKTRPPRDLAVILGAWLGGRFLTERYARAPRPHYPRLNISTDTFLPGIDAHYSQGDVHICPPDSGTNWGTDVLFIRGIDVGIHEYTHALNDADGHSERGPLSELSTYLTVSAHALPIKSSDRPAHDGTRDVNAAFREFEAGRMPDGARSVTSEYIWYQVGPWVRKYLEKAGRTPDPFEFSEPEERHLELRDIRDPVLREKLEKVFPALNDESLLRLSPEERFRKIKNVLNREFGVPAIDAPPGYAHAEGGDGFGRRA